MIARLGRFVRSRWRQASDVYLLAALRSDRRRRPTLLVIDDMLPDPLAGAGYPRAAAMITAAVEEGWHVLHYPLLATGAEYRSVRARFGRAVRFLQTRGVAGLDRLLSQVSGAVDAIMVSRPAPMAAVSEALARASVRVRAIHCIYDAEAVFSDREARRRALLGTPWSETEYRRALAAEIALTDQADVLIAVTEAEAALLRAGTRKPTFVVSHANPVVAREDGQFAARRGMLFVGRATGPREVSPNVDSLVWFVDEVMPILRGLPGGPHELTVVGLADDAIRQALAASDVRFMGVVEDLGPIFDAHRLFVAPTRFAAGLPQKVCDAAAHGLPCVATGLIAEQMGFADGREILAADTAEALAQACARLSADHELWSRVRTAAMASVAQRYAPEAFDRAMAAVLAAVPTRGRDR